MSSTLPSVVTWLPLFRGARAVPPYTLHPTPYTLHPTPYTLHPTPYTLCCIGQSRGRGTRTRDACGWSSLLE